MNEALASVAGIAAAAVAGLAVGVEREWSGHASGPQAKFAGVRTFTLLGGLAGMAGWLWTAQYPLAAAALLGGAAALVVAAYVAASRRNVDGTTEVAALVVLAAGFIAGTGPSRLALASGVIAVTLLVLVEKSRLHAMVARLSDEEVRAGARFGVMAVVILPLLPAGPYGPLGGIRPRELWAMVLLFSGLSFAGYIARRAVGARRGYPVAGLLGGMVSSMLVTLTFSRASRSERPLAIPLACGVVAASTMLVPRVLVATAILRQPLAVELLPYLIAPFLVGLGLSAVSIRWTDEGAGSIEAPANPLQFSGAVQLAVLFQLVLIVVHVVRETWGDVGLLLSGFVLGLSEVDALTVSMAKGTAGGVPIAVGAQAIALGILSNTLVKMGVALALGRSRFRWFAGGGLAALSVASAASIFVLW